MPPIEFHRLQYHPHPLFAIDCPWFTPWAGVCRIFDAGREMSMRVSLGSLPLFSNFPQSLPTDSRNPFSTSLDHNNMWQTFY